MEGGRGDRRVAHRDADLIERHNDIARRIDAGDARALLGIDDDATIVAQIDAELARERIVAVRPECRINGIEVQLGAVGQVERNTVVRKVHPGQRLRCNCDPGRRERRAIVGTKVDRLLRNKRDPFREGAQEQRFGNAVRVRADHPNRLPARLVAVADRTVAQHPPLQRVAVRIGIERRAAILDPGCDQDGARGDRHCGPLRFKGIGLAVDRLNAVRQYRGAVAFRLFAHPP